MRPGTVAEAESRPLLDHLEPVQSGFRSFDYQYQKLHEANSIVQDFTSLNINSAAAVSSFK